MKLSVLMLAFNHEPFIGQALDSILAQQTSFDYEIVIGEDFSKDGTRRIIAEYQQKHPQKIRPLLRERNIGGLENLIQTYRACTGQYIAALEGDDYWTDPRKLQLQLDLLDANPDMSFCFHRTRQLHPDGSTSIHPDGPVPPVLGIDDLLSARGNIVGTVSVVVRNHPIDDMLPFLKGLSMTDWAIHLYNARTGKVGFIDREMAAYRMSAGGHWAPKSLAWRTRETVRMLRAFDAFSARKFHPSVNRTICKLIYDLSVSGERATDWRSTRAYLRGYLLERPFDRVPSFISRLKLLTRLYGGGMVTKAGQ